MLKLRMILLAGAFAAATAPAFAVDLPDYGSKNFSPAGDTPSYFSNENASVSERIADTSQNDWSAVDELAPARAPMRSAHSARTHSGRHGRYSFYQSSGRHRSGGAGHAIHVGGAGGGSAGRTVASAAKTTNVKHARPGARHASAGAGRYTLN